MVPPPHQITVSASQFPPKKYLVRGIQVSAMSNQTLHDVMIAPGGSCQQRGLSLPVLDIHIAANFTEGFGHGVIAMPGSAVQGGFFFLLKDIGTEKENADGSNIKAMEDRDCSQWGKKLT